MSRALTLQDKVLEGEYSGLFLYAPRIEKTTREEPFRVTYDNAMRVINALKEKFGGSRWFAHEKDDSFKSSIGQIYQTFGGEDL